MRKLYRNKAGATLVEYALLVALLILIAIPALKTFEDSEEEILCTAVVAIKNPRYFDNPAFGYKRNQGDGHPQSDDKCIWEVGLGHYKNI